MHENKKGVEYTISDQILDPEDLSGITSMMDFNDTFNLVVGVKNTDIDWFDNPYIGMNVYELDQNWEPHLSPNIKLMNCTKQ